MLPADDHHYLAAAAARHPRAVELGRETRQDVLRSGADVVADLQRRQAPEGGHRALGGLEAADDVQRMPAFVGLVFGDAPGELPGVSQGAAVGLAGHRAGAVQQDQAQCPADSGVGVGAGARAECVAAGVEAKLPHRRAVDDQHEGRSAGAGGGSVGVGLRGGKRIDAGQHDR